MVDYRIGYGQSFDFYERENITGTTFGDSNDGYRQNMLIPFSTYGIIIVNEDPSVPVDISFDGFHVHETLSTAAGITSVTYLNRVVCKIWFKVASSSADVSVRAWGIR
jgi:hypothetical protein